MPVLTGIEACGLIKEEYRICNDKLNERNRNMNQDRAIPTRQYVLRPLICYTSQYEYAMFVHFVTEEEKPEIYLDKPVPVRELHGLLKLVKVL